MADDPLPFPEEFDTNLFTPCAPPPISIVRAGAFKKLMDSGEEIFTFHYKPHTSSTTAVSLRAVGNDPAPTTALHSEPLPTDEGELITKVVPSEYHDFFDVFSREEAKLMPPHCMYDHTIDLEDDQMPPHCNSYPLSGTELGILHKFLDDMLSKGFIRASNSPVGAPVLFAKKKDGTL